MHSRQCHPCTGCCDGWVKISITDYVTMPGKPCPHSTPNGCGDYENRPVDPCRKFICGWVVEDSPLPDWMKPNDAGVIVIFDKFRFSGVPVDLAVPTGKKIPHRSLDWLKRFALQYGRPLVYFENTKLKGKYTGESVLFAHGPPQFQAYVQSRIASNQTVW